MKKPNIFNYAPSELSQDAFICWLLSWGSPEAVTLNAELYKLSHKLLKGFFDNHNRRLPSQIKKLEIQKQYQHIDILVIINDSILIPIEDKIHNREHSDQLSLYLQSIKEEGYPEKNTLPIYLQTGEQGDYKKVQEAGFIPFFRKDLLNILKSGKHINNDILNDYLLNATTS